MRVVALPKPFYITATLQTAKLSPLADERLRELRRWWKLRENGFTTTHAAAILETPRATLYRWERRYRVEGPKGLEARSRRPHRLRQPTWGVELIEAVRRRRELPPFDGKDKIAAMLRRLGGLDLNSRSHPGIPQTAWRDT